MPRGGVCTPEMREDAEQFKKQLQRKVRGRRPPACRCTGHSWSFRRASPPILTCLRLGFCASEGLLGDEGHFSHLSRVAHGEHSRAPS